MSPRRLAVLIANLPEDTATKCALAGEAAGWSRTNVLLADLFAAFTGKDHPERKRVAENMRTADQRRRLLEQRRRHMREKHQRRE